MHADLFALESKDLITSFMQRVLNKVRDETDMARRKEQFPEAIPVVFTIAPGDYRLSGVVRSNIIDNYTELVEDPVFELRIHRVEGVGFELSKAPVPRFQSTALL